MRVVFAGTPEFARVALAAIDAAGHQVPLVLSQPDRPAGRGLKLSPSPVKAYAIKKGMALAQPRSVRLDGRYPQDAAAVQALLEQSEADVMVVAAYGLILPQWVLSLPRLGCLNIHASLLPRWRGAAPIHRAIEAGDTETGITIMQMDAGLDTGPMLLARAEPIDADDTTASLHERLAQLGGRLIVQALVDARDGRLQAHAQPVDGVTYAHKVDKAEAALDWALPATQLERRVRAFNPAPGASWHFAGQILKVWRAHVIAGAAAPGSVIVPGDGRIAVACGQDALELLELQASGAKRLATADFLRGHPL